MAEDRRAAAAGEAGDGGLDGFTLTVPEPVEQRDLVPAPPPEPFTLDYAFRHVGGRQAAIDLARLASASDRRLLKVVERWERLSESQQRDQYRLLESLCRAADIDPSEFLGLCVAIAHKFHVDVSSILTAVTLDDVVMAGVEQAKRPNGTRDRELLYQTKGLIVKGPGVAIQVNQGGVNSLPDFKSVAELALRATQQEPKQLPEYIDGEVVEVNDDKA